MITLITPAAGVNKKNRSLCCIWQSWMNYFESIAKKTKKTLLKHFEAASIDAPKPLTLEFDND